MPWGDDDAPRGHSERKLRDFGPGRDDISRADCTPDKGQIPRGKTGYYEINIAFDADNYTREVKSLQANAVEDKPKGYFGKLTQDDKTVKSGMCVHYTYQGQPARDDCTLEQLSAHSFHELRPVLDEQGELTWEDHILTWMEAMDKPADYFEMLPEKNVCYHAPTAYAQLREAGDAGPNWAAAESLDRLDTQVPVFEEEALCDSYALAEAASAGLTEGPKSLAEGPAYGIEGGDADDMIAGVEELNMDDPSLA
eukprot:tig00000980_g6132.t1